MTIPTSTPGPSALPPPSQQTNGFAVASLVLGIVGIFIVIAAILATIFGGIAIGQIRRNPSRGGHGLAVAGLVLGIIGIVLWLALVAFVMLVVVSFKTVAF